VIGRVVEVWCIRAVLSSVQATESHAMKDTLLAGRRKEDGVLIWHSTTEKKGRGRRCAALSNASRTMRRHGAIRRPRSTDVGHRHGFYGRWGKMKGRRRSVVAQGLHIMPFFSLGYKSCNRNLFFCPRCFPAAGPCKTSSIRNNPHPDNDSQLVAAHDLLSGTRPLIAARATHGSAFPLALRFPWLSVSLCRYCVTAFRSSTFRGRVSLLLLFLSDSRITLTNFSDDLL
jgi:hypothetical protein